MNDAPDVQPKNGRRVLCVEDEHFISELYTRALLRGGYEVETVVDGLEGLKQAQTNQFDIILLDMMLPNITGFDILKKLRGPGSQPIRAKIIITTNLELDATSRADIEHQADGYIIKAEVTPHQLVEFLDQIEINHTE